MKKTKYEQFSWRTISRLPTDTTTNIFSRLTLADLQQSQLVCKDWYKTLNSNNSCLIVCRTQNNCSKLYTVMHRADRLETPLKVHIVYSELPKEERFRIVGSAKDFVCVASMSNYGDFYACKPDKGRIFKLSEPPSLEGHCLQVEPRDYLPCGFAFDKITGNYKLVYIVSSSTGGNGVKTEIEICSFAERGTPTWRRIEDHPSFVSRDISSTNSMVLLNGALHWLAKDTEFVSRHRNSGIVSVLDVENESCKILGTPVRTECTTLGVLSDCLCICGEIKDECKIWLMKDYGVESSWTVEYSFQKEILGPLHKLDCVNVVRKMSNGSVLLHCGGDQGYYDFDKNEFKEIVLDGFEKDEIKEIVFDGDLPCADYTEIINHGVNLTVYTVLNF